MDNSQTSNKLRVGFLSSKNYFDRLSFSGILYSMYHALSRHADVVPLGSPYRPTQWRELAAKVGRRARRLMRLGDKSAPNLSAFSRRVERQLSQTPLDFVFAPVASRELRALNLQQPVAYASDATCRLLHETYGLSASAEQRAAEESAERLAIQKATAITYSSSWAAESAIRDYGTPHEKICVIPYGANLIAVPASQEVFAKCENRPCKLVFIGLYWHRKGGDIALKTLETLRARGLNAELTIIGAKPPEGHASPHVRVVGFLDKRRSRDGKALREILLSSHVMLFPSRADCSPIALCEAAAYGIPVVAANVGGISSILTEKTGRLIPKTGSPEEYAAAVMEIIGDRDRYREFIRSSRERYDNVLNWDKWAQSLLAFCAKRI